MKKYIIGALIGFMLSLGVGAHAEVISLINKTVDGMFPVTIDGKPLGDAIVVDNKTYLPVREFGEAVGYKVTFTDTREVVMTKNTVLPTPVPSTTSAPQPTPPAMTKAQKIDRLNNLIPDLEVSIQALKIGIISEERDGLKDNNIAIYKKRLADKEKELADLQSQLTALQSQP